MNLALVLFGCLAPALVWLVVPLHDWWYALPDDLEFGFFVFDRRKEWP